MITESCNNQGLQDNFTYHSLIHFIVLLNNNVSNYFRTTVGVRQGCLLSPILFNLYLENIMRETLHNFKSTISIGGQIISNLRFAHDIDLMGGNNDELQELTDRLSNSAREYGMEISSEKIKVMVNSGDNTTVQISMNCQTARRSNGFQIPWSYAHKGWTLHCGNQDKARHRNS